MTKPKQKKDLKLTKRTKKKIAKKVIKSLKESDQLDLIEEEEDNFDVLIDILNDSKGDEMYDFDDYVALVIDVLTKTRYDGYSW